jgi:hypothetical protein
MVDDTQAFEVDAARGSNSKVHCGGILHKTLDAIEVPSDGF